MDDFQNILYSHPLDIEKLKMIIQKMSNNISPDEIDHELILAFSLNFDLVPILVPFLFKKVLDSSDLLYHHDPLLLLKLKHSGALSDSVKIPQRYLNDGSDEDKEVHFGGELAKIIKNDDDNKLSSMMASFSFDINGMIEMYDELYCYHNVPLLNFAIQMRSQKCTQMLIEYGANPALKAMQYEPKWDALGFAAATGNIELFQMLMKNGATFSKNTVEAASMFHQNIILKFIINFPKYQPEWSKIAILSCAKWNNIEGLKIMIDSRADLNVRNNEGFSQ